jgi:3-hydroxyisobutyrate dehydrogenase-like beta-hydroxyacid dehydrogenase
VNLVEREIGVIGLGQMGGGVAANLVRAGYVVTGYDLKEEAIARLIEVGGQRAASSEEIVTGCDVVMTSVEGHVAIELADTILLPNARPGQAFIELSTVSAPETRRIGRAFVEEGCAYLDAPLSGGARGAAAGTLRIFVGGDKETAERYWPLFEAVGNPDKIVYGGPIGMGQVVKVVQQLTRRWPDVARMEVMAFGLRAGLDLETVMRALDVTPDADNPYARLYRTIQRGETDRLSGLFAEWAYYLEEIRAQGFRMPMLEAMYAFCKDAERVSTDVVGRPQPSVWNELMRGD